MKLCEGLLHIDLKMSSLLPSSTTVSGRQTVDGVTLGFLLGTFLEECAKAGLNWSLPTSQNAWRERLENGCHLSLCANPSDSENEVGYFCVPELFAGEADSGNDRGVYPGSFKLAKAVVIGVPQQVIIGATQLLPSDERICLLADYTGRITRNLIVIAAPMDLTGTVRPEYACEVPAGELVLLKTRDLVYNHIGNLCMSFSQQPVL